MYVIVQNFVLNGRTAADINRFFLFLFKMAAVRHLGFCTRACLDHARQVFCGIYHCANFGWNRCSSFDNTQVLIFNAFGLKRAIHAPNGGCLGGFCP